MDLRERGWRVETEGRRRREDGIWKEGGRGKGLGGGEREGAFSKARGHVNLGKNVNSMCNCSKRDQLILYHSPLFCPLSFPLGAANFCQSGICTALIPPMPVPLLSPLSLSPSLSLLYIFTLICLYRSFPPPTHTDTNNRLRSTHPPDNREEFGTVLSEY